MALEFQGTPHEMFFGSIEGEPVHAPRNSLAMKEYRAAVNRIHNHLRGTKSTFTGERSEHTRSGADPSKMPNYALWEQVWPEGTTSGD